MKYLVAPFTFVFLLTFAASNAEASYCDENERFAPTGRIVALGTRYFRVCSAEISSRNRELHYVLLRGGPTMERLSSDYPDLRKVMIIEGNGAGTAWEQLLFNTIWRNKEKLMNARLGKLEYSVFVDRRYRDEMLAKLESGELPTNATYLYSGVGGEGIPDHLFTCLGVPRSNPVDRYHCALYIRYEDIHVLNRVTWFPTELEGIKPPFSFDDIPWHIRGLTHVLRQMDVTDQIDGLRRYVPVVE